MISRSYKATKTTDGNYYLYLTVKKTAKDRNDKYLGKIGPSDKRIQLILDRKESSNKLQVLAKADSISLGME